MEHLDFSGKDSRKATLEFPQVVFGTSGLGNLFIALEEFKKRDIIQQCIMNAKGKVVFDTAGKYGAGLALEVLGRSLTTLNVSPQDVVISNKLGWLRTPLQGDEPTFEPGVWKDLSHDAKQSISYDGILECFEQGNHLLGAFNAQMVSVHDPDEYIATAQANYEKDILFGHILDAYRALFDLKRQGKVHSVGVGAKNWRTIQRIANTVPLDWVMFANSMTLYKHPKELRELIEQLDNRGTIVINSAVFHSGFLIGTDNFDYKNISRLTHPELFTWRDVFFETCDQFGIKPAHACVQFALSIPGVSSIALNTTESKRVHKNVEMAETALPDQFWHALQQKGAIDIKPKN